MIIDHIYVLNLKRAPERKEHMQKILNENNLIENKDYTILEGIDGKSISKDEANEINRVRRTYYTKYIEKCKPLTRGQLGCIKSHLLAYQKMLQNGHNLCLILEDDSKFIKSYSEILNILSTFPLGYNFDYMLLHRKCVNLCLKARGWPFVKNWFTTPNNDESLGTNKIFTKAGLTYGTNSQLVTASGAKKLLEWFKTIYDPMDIQIHMMNCHTNVFNSEKHEGLRMYATLEPLMEPAGFTSLTQRIR